MVRLTVHPNLNPDSNANPPSRTIQGTVLPMLIDSSAADPIDALAHRAKKGLLLIGQPNVGKTTVLRELSRLLSAGNSRVVVIVDKSMVRGLG